jgi:hypothetical protein
MSLFTLAEDSMRSAAPARNRAISSWVFRRERRQYRIEEEDFESIFT